MQFEPHILFQKLAVAAERTDKIDPETIFKHELTTIPKALAETPELLHEAQKSTLADTLWTTANPNAASIPDNVRYVLDGGALLHRIPWSRGASYESILETYSKNSQIRAARFFMTKQMQTFSLSKRQLSQHPQWIQF